MGTIAGLLLLPGEDDGAEDGYEDEDRGDLKGEQEFGEEDGAKLGDVVDAAVEVASDAGAAEGVALGEKDEAEEAEDGRGPGDADDVGGAAAVGTLLDAGVEQHDDEDEEDHDGAGVDDDLGGGEELGTEGPVEDGEGDHDDDQRKGRVDGMALEEQIERARDRQDAKDDEQSQLHEIPLGPSFETRRSDGLTAGKKTIECISIVKQRTSIPAWPRRSW